MHVFPTTYPISWFKDRNLEKTLILKPPYQRKPVWTYDQKAYLIDTILKKYHIPAIYIHRETDAEGKSNYNIVDGQQRIRSILDFINGDFALSETYNPEYADYNFDDLPDSVQQYFWGYILYVREITGATENDVRNMFKRMNKNVVALNAQELRHATYSGDFIRLMEELAEDDAWAENKIVTANQIRRMKDVEFLSSLFISMMHGIQDKTKELDKYYQFYEEKDNFRDKSKWRKLFQKTVDMIFLLFPDIKEYRWRNKSDFYTLFVCIRNIVEKSYIPTEKIKKLRTALVKFSTKIDNATKKENKNKRFPKEISDYANSVTKSTTDKDRRIIRNKILMKIITKYAKAISSK